MRPLVAATTTVLAAAGVGLGCTPDETGPDTLARIQASGEIVWGADLQGGEPYVYEDPADPSRLIGFEVDIMAGIARRLGVKQRVVQANWSNLVPSLERGDFDVAMNGLEATTERQARLLLSRPYFVFAETLAVRRGSAVRSLADLDGKRVGTLNQTTAYDMLRALPVELVLYEGVEEPYIDLEQGRIDAVLLDNISADRYGCTRAGVVCLPDDVAIGAYIIGIRKTDRELKAAIDGALDQMRDDGELRRILERWRLWDRNQTMTPPVDDSRDAEARGFDAGQAKLFAQGAGVTLALSIASFLLAVPLGLGLAVVRIYGGPVSRFFARAYIELFRGTPVLLQLYVLYFGLAPVINLGPVQASILGLGLNYAAYEAEVYRGAILAVPFGQTEAAQSLGLSGWQTLRHILLPQGLRVALPAMTNDFVALLKDSSLVSVITVVELTKRMTIAAVDLHGWLIPGLACAALYFAMSFPLSELARRLEARLSHDRHPRAV